MKTPSPKKQGQGNGASYADMAREKQEFEALFDGRYGKLNKAQKKAVDTIDGPLLVVAGPGSGKTEILSMRVAQILRQTQAMPSNILCLTFTDSASQNMRQRLSRLVGDRAYQVAIHTFHNFCVDIIRKHGEFFYHGATFSPADPVTQITILEQIFNAMDHDNPLRSYHPEEGFVFLKATLTAIGHIKKSGIRPGELEIILQDNMHGFNLVKETLVPVFDKKIHKDSISEIQSALDTFIAKGAERIAHAKKSDSTSALGTRAGVFSIFHPVEEAIALSLAEALAKAKAEGKNEPLSKWKTKWLVKDDFNARVFKDELNLPKMRAFAQVYAQYQNAMHKRGHFDFDDMILDVIGALEKEPRLRYELQEQFQYVLVDEFQDTNNAQMRIIALLTSAPEHAGRPNIMVVGDDDQAIYKFQGAELSNILDFRHRYVDVEMVTMTENYRSTQGILDIAMSIIRKGEKRLENLIPDLSKQLMASGALGAGIDQQSIHSKVFETALHEYKYVAQKIKGLIEAGEKPEEIAVIARKHGNLEGIVPFMKLAQVPIKYEREQSVFAEPHISELITIARYIASTVSAFAYEDPRDDLLPQILSFKFWNVSRTDIWKISLKAKREQKTWLEVMVEYDANPLVQQIANFLIDLGAEAQSAPLETVLDKIVGAHLELTPQTEHDEGDEAEAVSAGSQAGVSSAGSSAGTFVSSFVSPFRSFYFSKDKFSHARAEYLTFLSSLRVFINALRAFNGFEDVTVQELGSKSPSATDAYRVLRLVDLVKFVDVYEKNQLKLNDESPFVTARSAVQLMSAHKSKGLEFKVVFVLSCQDDIWASRGGGTKISFPINMQVEPAGDSEDDQLRLFYVALTRAREQLYLTSHQVKDNGKQASQLRFLVDSVESTVESVEGESQVSVDELLETEAVSFRNAPFLDTEQALLHSLLEEYQLSVTHLNNFLNIPKGGPNLFFEQNLLRFPQSKSPSGGYGSAIHGALECLLHELKSTGAFPSVDTVCECFDKMLKKQKLHPSDYAMFRKRGMDALKLFMEKKEKEFKPTDIAELDFSREHIMITDLDTGEKAAVTGKIDKVSVSDDAGEEGDIRVHDYKTGKAFESFEDAEAGEAVKVHQYKNQLLFYKLLIENSGYAQNHLFTTGSRKVCRGIIDFVEPIGAAKNIRSVSIELTDEDLERLKKLIVAVYQRIKNLDFEIPVEIATRMASNEFKHDIDAIVAFEEYLLAA